MSKLELALVLIVLSQGVAIGYLYYRYFRLYSQVTIFMQLTTKQVNLLSDIMAKYRKGIGEIDG